jgi:hypothetical protein
MDVALLAASAAGLIVRFLPYLKHITPWLRDTGEGAADHVQDELETAAGRAARHLLDKLGNKIEGDPYAKVAAQQAAKNPEDERAAHRLASELRAILEGDSDLAAQVDEILKDAEQSGVGNVYVRADHGSAAVGRDSYGSITIGSNPPPQAVVPPKQPDNQG